MSFHLSHLPDKADVLTAAETRRSLVSGLTEHHTSSDSSCSALQEPASAARLIKG